MKQMLVVAFLIVSLMAFVFTGCTFQLDQPLTEPEAQLDAEAAVEAAVDYRLNPELLFLERAGYATFAPATVAVTEAGQLVGEWVCEEEAGQQVIRMDPDGRIFRVHGPHDAVDIGYFWFSDGEFHVVSDVDEAANESVFHVAMEANETGTVLRFAQCGGNCPNAGDIEWLNGLTRS